jgi:ABC-type transport system substrate-binding protein
LKPSSDKINRAPGMRFGVNLEVIKSIEVVDPYTVQIAMKAFDPIFLLRMVGYQQGYIVSKKAAEKEGEQFKWNPVGTGPFYFDRHLPREKVVLKAFDKYHAGRRKALDRPCSCPKCEAGAQARRHLRAGPRWPLAGVLTRPTRFRICRTA